MNRYAEMRKRQQEEVNALPIGFAFGNRQFEEMMRGWGLDPEKDLDKIYRLGNTGGFYKIADKQIIRDTFSRHEEELRAAIEEDKTGEGFIYEMFLCELNDHEYGYTMDTEETLTALGYTTDEVLADARLRRIVAMEVTPVTLKDALSFVRQNHRHCTAPQGHKYSIGIKASGTLIGVVIASTPKARALDDGRTLELNRICCDPAYRNAVSMVCGAAIRAAKAMGYHRIVTYTLPQESGSSMRAIGFQQDGITSARPTGWNCRNRPRILPEKYPYGEKIRWILKLK